MHIQIQIQQQGFLMFWPHYMNNVANLETPLNIMHSAEVLQVYLIKVTSECK